MSKLDDLLGKKKTVVTVLDLSKTIVQSKDEFKRLWEKVPDYKMRPIKVRADEIKIKDKDFSFKMPRKETRKLLKCNGVREPAYIYLDPVPNEMKEVVLADLCSIQIDWKMLTTLRPKLKTDEEYFSRLVEMGKLEIKTEARDRRDFQMNSYVRKVKNKSGIVESRVQTCTECAEEMCNGSMCSDYNYDLFTRVELKAPSLKTMPVTSNKTKLSGAKKLGNARVKSHSKTKRSASTKRS